MVDMPRPNEVTPTAGNCNITEILNNLGPELKQKYISFRN